MWQRLADVAGGVQGRRAVVLLALLLSLSAADGGAMGALARPLERQFRIGNTELGLLVTASSLVGALATLPMGVLVDRVQRTRLLVVVVCLWSLAMIGCGLATTYLFLMIARLFLGLVTAAGGPAVASLSGDLFPPERRSWIYGWILSGELLGAGAGLLVAGNIGMATSWRVTFFLLAAFSAALALAVQLLLKEPERNPFHHLTAERQQPDPATRPAVPNLSATGAGGDQPDRRQAARRNPAELGMWRAGLYVLGISTNRILIVSSALGYFFVAGIRTFSVLYAETRFGLDTGTISLLVVLLGGGALIGTMGGGRVADWLVNRKRLDARLTVSGLAFMAVPLLFLPGALSPSIAISMPFFVTSTVALTAPNAPLDAARLDVVPSGLWGRAESVRTLARSVLEAFAPLVFGLVSSLIATGHITGVGFGLASNSGAGPGGGSNPLPGVGRGLNDTFMLMLIPLAASGALLVHHRRAYLRDMATAAAAEPTDMEAGAEPPPSNPV